MALIDAPQFNLAAQTKQFGQFSSETNQVKANDVLQCLADPAKSGVVAQLTVTPASQSAEQFAAYIAVPSHPQFKGVFTSDKYIP